MKKDFIFKAIVFPIAASIILAAVSIIVLNINVKSLVPFEKGTKVLSFDSVKLPEETVNVDSESFDISKLNNNDLIGTVGDTDLRYNADYSALNSSASLKGALPSQKGCSYIRLGAQKALEAGKSIEIEDLLGSAEFSLTDEKTVNSETDVFAIAPEYENSLVVYYSEADGVGLTSHYRVLVYKEVK